MHLEHSCFISYPRLQNSLVERVVIELDEAISQELRLYKAPPAHFERVPLIIDEKFEETQTRALYNSASMVLIFAPIFFSEKNLQGARELLAMEQLEKQRLEYLPDRHRGLIMPVVLRGRASLPALFKDRQFVDLSEFMLYDHKLSNNPLYAPKIQEIARYVFECYRDVSSLSEGSADREHFTLPSIEETRKWLQRISEPADRFPFPSL